MEYFSKIINKYKIKCYNDEFSNTILKNYNNISYTETIDVNTLLIGIYNKIKIDHKLNILILGYELEDEKIIGYFIRNYKKINFFTLSELNAKYYLDNYNIKSTVINFDLPSNLLLSKFPNTIIYFNKNINDITTNINDFSNYKNKFYEINKLKIIIFESLLYIYNPYVNIIYTAFPDRISIINFYYKNAYLYLENISNISNININVYYIFDLIKYISNIPSNIKYLQSDIGFPLLNCSNKYSKNCIIIISDNLSYLETFTESYIFKIYISKNDICFKKNNIIHIHKYFFENKKINDRKKKEVDNFYFIITDINDIPYLNTYLQLYKKYFPKKNIKIYSNLDINIPNSIDVNLFFPKDNTKIFYSSNYNIELFINKIIFMNNIELQIINKLHVLVASTQYPNYGGAATNAYNIIKYLKKNNNLYTTGIFINNNIEKNIIDPDNIDNICGITYNFSPNEYKYYNSFPDIAFCKNTMAPKIIKKIFPNCIIIFLVSGIMGFSEINYGANEITDFSIMKKNKEIESIEISNLIICNSNLTLNYYKKIYKDILEKKNNLYQKSFDSTKYNTLDIINNDNDNNDKSIDIIIIASNINRSIKNIQFIKNLILSSKKIQNYKIMVIGENSDIMFNNICNLCNIKLLPLINQAEVDKYLMKSKIILIPSLFDSNSNTFREAVMSNVIPFISINVAHPVNFPEYFIINKYNCKEWEKRIVYTIENYDSMYKKYNFKKCFENNDEIESFL